MFRATIWINYSDVGSERKDLVMARDQAYQEAAQRIEKARQEGAIKLDLSDIAHIQQVFFELW